MVSISQGVVRQAEPSLRVHGQGGTDVGCAWRIRHKLILGLGLVVAIIALLLVGTYKGLASYMSTTKTMQSKLLELTKAYDLKSAIAALAVSSKPEEHGNRDEN